MSAHGEPTEHFTHIFACHRLWLGPESGKISRTLCPDPVHNVIRFGSQNRPSSPVLTRVRVGSACFLKFATLPYASQDTTSVAVAKLVVNFASFEVTVVVMQFFMFAMFLVLAWCTRIQPVVHCASRRNTRGTWVFLGATQWVQILRNSGVIIVVSAA